MDTVIPRAPVRVVLVVSAVLLATFWIALPMRLPSFESTVSNEECLTLADRPPPLGGGGAATLQRCVEFYPDDVELLADLGAAHEAAGETAQAEAVYQRALAADPGYGEVRLRLGRLLLQRGATDDARRHAEAGLVVQPNRRPLVDLLEATRATTPSITR